MASKCRPSIFKNESHFFTLREGRHFLTICPNHIFHALSKCTGRYCNFIVKGGKSNKISSVTDTIYCFTSVSGMTKEQYNQKNIYFNQTERKSSHLSLKSWPAACLFVLLFSYLSNRGDGKWAQVWKVSLVVVHLYSFTLVIFRIYSEYFTEWPIRIKYSRGTCHNITF